MSGNGAVSSRYPFLGADPVDDEQLARRRAEHEAYRAEHGSWHAIATSIREERDELDDELRVQAIDALNVLRKEFDEDWPLRFFGSEARAASVIGNNAAWTAKMLIVLARDIEAAKAAPGWHVVRRGLMEPNSADPALLQLELGARALRHGLQISFEPPGRKSRRADLHIQSDTAALNVECTSIQAFPDASDEASRVSWTLCPMIRIGDLGLHVGGWATRPFDDDELTELAVQAMEFYERCSRANEPNEFLIPGTLYLWATPINHPKANAFIDARGGKITFTVGFQHDPLARLMATIDRKARSGQLLTGEPGLLVIEPSRLLSQVHIGRICAGARQALEPYAHINAVALVHRFLGTRPDSDIDLGQEDFGTVQTLYRPIQENVVVVRNPARAHSAGDTLINHVFRKQELGFFTP